MSDIYQQIWDADQSESGVVPLLDTADGNPLAGYAKVNTRLQAGDKSLRVLPDVLIPDHKKRTYDLCRELFDNFALPERDEETDSAEEREEVHDLVQAMVDSAPMRIARDYISFASGTALTRERWYNTVMDHWFRRFSSGGDPDLSGFEHVVVGEQEGPKAQGYHFWYKYYLDDGFAHLTDDAQSAFPGLNDDRIVYLGAKQSAEQSQFPETVTISYKWDAPDYDRDVMRPLTKKIGGFFVGCSVEGLLALGSVRAHLGARAPKEATINGARYAMKLFRSGNNRHVRTFYPVFLGPSAEPGPTGPVPPTEPTQPTQPTEPIIVVPPTPTPPPIIPVTASDLRIIAALVNPEGHDPGRESVTLINVGAEDADLRGLFLQDKNRKRQSLPAQHLVAGDTLRLTLDPSGVQLSNKGGRITLLSAAGESLASVTYSKGQARAQGYSLLF